MSPILVDFSHTLPDGLLLLAEIAQVQQTVFSARAYPFLGFCRTRDPEWKRFGFVLSFNQCNLDCGTDLETLRDFTSTSSDCYPNLASHYSQVIDEWYSLQEKAAG
jgi:hypothetical protein